MSRPTDHGEVCRGMLADANTRAELHRRERNSALKELAETRAQLTQAYRWRDVEAKRADRALRDLDQKDHELAELKAEIEALRVRLARPLIPEAIA